MAPARRSGRAKPAASTSASASKSSNSHSPNPSTAQPHSPAASTIARSTSSTRNKRVKEEQADDTMPPAAPHSNSRRGRQQKEQPTEQDDEEDEENGVTRCICGSNGEEDGFMIMCESCKAWQHGLCLGYHEEKDCPEVYYCERCRPDLHTELLKRLKRTRNNSTISAKSEPTTKRIAVADRSIRATSSRSPSPLPKPKSPKRRSTMNSRDAAYDISLALALSEAHKREIGAKSDRSEIGDKSEVGAGDAPTEPAKRKRKRSGSIATRDESAQPSKRPRSSSSVSDRPIATVAPLPSTDDCNPDLKIAEIDAENIPSNDTTTGGQTSSNGSTSGKKTSVSNAKDDGNKKGKARVGPKSVRKSTSDSVEAPAEIDGDEEEDPSTVAAPPSTNKRTRKLKDEDAEVLPKPKPSNTPASTSRRPPISPVKRPQSSYGNNEHNVARRNGNGQSRLSNGDSGRSTNENGRNSGNNENGQSRSGSPPLPLTAYWNLPDYLSHLAHILPVNYPVAGSSTKERLSIGEDDSFSTPSSQHPVVKVKWPGKRITIGDMNKRVRSIMEFVVREQAGALVRATRVEALEKARVLAISEGKVEKNSSRGGSSVPSRGQSVSRGWRGRGRSAGGSTSGTGKKGEGDPDDVHATAMLLDDTISPTAQENEEDLYPSWVPDPTPLRLGVTRPLPPLISTAPDPQLKPPPMQTNVNIKADQDVVMDNADSTNPNTVASTTYNMAVGSTPSTTTIQAMAELMQDLLLFQEKFRPKDRRREIVG